MGTINQISWIIYLGIIVFALFLHYKNSKNAVYEVNNISDLKFSKIYTILIPLSLILIGAALRLHLLSEIPLGLHQDEASIGYESFILSEFGVDRDGNHLPIYPITYGSGGGSPLMIYLNAFTTKIFGSSPLILRALPAVLGVATLVVLFLLIRTLSRESLSNSRKTQPFQYITAEYLWIPLVCLTIMALAPWHVMLSRWSLDCNTTPFWIISALLLFSIGVTKKEKGTLYFALSAVLYSLTIYSYGAATIVIPLHLIILCVLSIRKRKMTVSQMIIGIVVFLVVSLPLIIFYVVNFLGLPEITTPLVSITKFTAKRSIFVSGQNLLPSVWHNLVVMIKNLTIGCDSEQIVNYIPGFPPLLAFTFPMTILGFILSILRTRKGIFLDQAINSLFCPSFIFGLFVEEDITRMVLIFIPVIYYLARGFIFVVNEFVTVEKAADNRLKKTCAIAAKALSPALFLIGAFLFSQVYFTDYNKINSGAFMPGYGEACAYADSITGYGNHVYSTYENLSAPFMIALYYTKTPPQDFLETVHYKDLNAEFRIADSFTHFKFGLPEDLRENFSNYIDNGDIFILHKSELTRLKEFPEYESKDVDIRLFYDFIVISKS